MRSADINGYSKAEMGMTTGAENKVGTDQQKGTQYPGTGAP